MRKVLETVVFLSVCLLLLAGCRHDARPEEYFLELDNKELEREIIAFTKEKEQESGNRNFMVNVGCKDINDSIKRYILFYNSQGWSWRVSPFHFVCRVGGRDVMFTMVLQILILICFLIWTSGLICIILGNITHRSMRHSAQAGSGIRQYMTVKTVI